MRDTHLLFTRSHFFLGIYAAALSALRPEITRILRQRVVEFEIDKRIIASEFRSSRIMRADSSWIPRSALFPSRSGSLRPRHSARGKIIARAIDLPARAPFRRPRPRECCQTSAEDCAWFRSSSRARHFSLLFFFYFFHVIILPRGAYFFFFSFFFFFFLFFHATINVRISVRASVQASLLSLGRGGGISFRDAVETQRRVSERRGNKDRVRFQFRLGDLALRQLARSE